MLSRSVVVRSSAIAGTGLFATQPISAGTVVWTLDADEPRLTYDALQSLPGAEQSLAFQFRDTYIICHDGSQYMNHSCEPNLWWLSDMELAAKRDIALGEEITYDYVTADISPPWKATWRCQCGATTCRRTIASTDYQDAAWQRQYSGHLPSWVVRAIDARVPS